MGVEFFLGCKTTQGFLSLFSQLQNPEELRKTYILKGGPGSGKSTLMRKLGGDLAQLGHSIEWIPCASDPASLDAFIDHTARVAMLDGTAPHVVDPRHPGAVETVVNAAQGWDEAALSQRRSDIVDLTGQIDYCHARASAYIQAAGALLDHNRKVAAAYVDQKAVGYWIGLIENHLQPGSGAARERLLSAVSVGELKFFSGTLHTLCDTVFTISDDWGAAAALLLARLRDRALERGAGVITCHCSISGRQKIDHLIFPEQRLAVCTVNAFLPVDHPHTIGVESLSQSLPTYLSEPLVQAFHTAGDLLEQAQEQVARSKSLHDELEHIYVSAMDFSKMDALYETLRAELTGKAQD